MDYVTIHEEYKIKFFQIPKVLFTNDRYVGLSNNARVVWAILRDRASLSRKNGWYEKDTGRIYFMFTNKELCEVTKIKSETTITTIKKELVAAKLLEQKVRPNRGSILYIGYPIIDDEDIYHIDEMETAEHPEEVPQTQTGKGTPKIGVPKIGVPEPQKLVPNDTDSINTDFKRLDTLDTRDTKNDSKQKNMPSTFTDQEREKLKDEYEKQAFYENTNHVPERIAHMLKVYSSTIEESEAFYKIILTAKKKAEKDVGFMIYFEREPELEHEVINTFIRSIRKIETSDVDNPRGYIFNSIYHLIVRKVQSSGLIINN